MDETTARRVIRETPLVDGFCRLLLDPEQQLLQSPQGLLALLFPEPGGGHTLARSRAMGQLAKLLGCPPTPAHVGVAMSKHRANADTYAAWMRHCLDGAQARLHSPQPLPLPSNFGRHVAQVETLIESFLDESDPDENSTEVPWDSFNWVIDRAVELAIDDPDVYAFDSISCLRDGPGSADADAVEGAAREAYGHLMDLERRRRATGQPAPAFRLQHPCLNRYVLHRVATLMRDRATITTTTTTATPGSKKPVRLHTGHGHTETHVLLANVSPSPSDLQRFVAAYPSVPFVLMGAGYPKTCEAAYLASVNPNVYVDLGLALPLLDRQGQDRLLYEVLEVCPWTKVLGGTGGGRVPEAYYLGQLQLRDLLNSVLCSLARQGDMSWDDVVDATRGILYDNANKLYQLGLPSLGRFGVTGVAGVAEVTEGDYGKDGEDGTATTTANSIITTTTSTTTGTTTGTTTYTPTDTPYPPPLSADEQLRILESEMAGQIGDPTAFVVVSFVDYSGIQRQKSVHVGHLWSSLQRDVPLSIAITEAVFGLLPNDHLPKGVPPSGEYQLHPDFSWIKRTPDGQMSMHGEFRHSNDSPVAKCPRHILRRTLDVAQEAGLEFRIGFEIEFVIMRRHTDNGSSSSSYHPLDGSEGHAWCTARAGRYPGVMALLRKAVAHLVNNGILVEQLHAESAPGQFEIVLPHAPPLEAVDNLVFARQVISDVVAEAGLVMTMHPKPFPNRAGTAAHAHVSLCSVGGDDPAVYGPFWAGVLNRLPAVTALTLPTPCSWTRAVDGAWAGGTHVSWGTQNRETPLRKIRDSHWEVKCIDGTANPFLAVAAIVAAGVLGVVKKESLHAYHDLAAAPARMSAKDLASAGSARKLPGSTLGAVTALIAQEDLGTVLGRAFVDRYVAVKIAEDDAWEQMSAPERRAWVLDRY